ncbi:MAG: hypothetical protein H6Q51_760 [Deltaproteobacteria bacterium]|nr:hypothetical protein [Deltaproteobacteria bacterium]
MTRLPLHLVCAGLVTCLLLVAPLSLVSTQSDEASRPLVVTGSGPAPSREVADARDLALREALRSAVEQTVGRLLPAQRIVRYYPLLGERIFDRSMTYVQDYQIVHETKGPQLYRVTVQTTLHMDRLRQDLQQLGLFLTDAERPTVVVLVAEKPGPKAPWVWWWRTSPPEQQSLAFTQAIGRVFSSRGLIVLSPSSLLGKLPQDQTYQEPLLGDGPGSALGKALGARIVVAGEVSHQPAAGGSPATATGSLRALRTDSGQLVTQAAATIPVQPTPEQPSPGHGFTALAERLGSQLADAILAPVITGGKAAREVTVRVLGVRSYGDLLRIKEYLQEAPGVTRVDQVQLQGAQGSVTVVFSGGIEEVGRALQGRDFGAFTTSTDSVGEDSITVSIMKR